MFSTFHFITEECDVKTLITFRAIFWLEQIGRRQNEYSYLGHSDLKATVSSLHEIHNLLSFSL